MIYKFDKCNLNVADEALKFIELYRLNKNNDISDVFYHKHLDCFQSLIEMWKNMLDDYNAVIVNRKGRKNKDGSYSMTFATICIKPHWNFDSVMFTGSVYGATKFPLSSDDLWLFYNYIKNSRKNKEIDILILPKEVDSACQNWSNSYVRGDFDKTGMFKGVQLKEV